MAAAGEAFEAALAGLVDVTVLKSAIAEYDTVDGSLYTKKATELIPLPSKTVKSFWTPVPQKKLPLLLLRFTMQKPH